MLLVPKRNKYGPIESLQPYYFPSSTLTSSASLAQTFHDVRNALNVILGNAQLLQESKPLTFQQQEYTARIVNAVREVSAALGNYAIEVGDDRNELKATISVTEKGKANG